MRVTVVGAGAIGASIGGAFAHVGNDVTLVTRPGPRRDALERGLRLTGAFGDVEPRVTLAHAPPADADVVLVAVQLQDLHAALDAVAKSGSACPVVTMQNGVTAEERALDVLPPERLIGCVTVYDAIVRDADGPFTVHVPDRARALLLGRPNGAPDAVVRDLAERWRRALPVSTTRNLAGARWTKLLVNLNNALPAALGTSMQDAYADARVARLAARMLREGVTVARAEGVRLEPLPWVKPGLIRLLAALPLPVSARLLARRVQGVLGDDPSFGSTYQSVRRGSATEIDHLNGEVVKRGRARRLSVAANAAVTRAVKSVEATGRHWAVERLLAEVRPED